MAENITLLTKTDTEPRYDFLDQCRGYAIFGMIFVNTLGLFDRMPWMLKHHHVGFSYADSIAPLFIFVVGMSFRLSFLKAQARCGLAYARKRAMRRNATLMVLGLVFGGFHLRVAVWDALMDIGASGMLALPFMQCAAPVRAMAAIVSLGLYQLLYSCVGYGDWVMANSINGGPLGPLSWAFILLMGTLAFDHIDLRRPNRMIMHYGCWAAVLSLPGWLLRMQWSDTKMFWPFSQFGMSAPYTLYASGLCFATVLGFYFLRERLNFRAPFLTTMGRNPLVLYMMQGVLVLVMRAVIPATVSSATAVICFCVVFGLCYGAAKYLENKGRYIKI